MLLPLPVSGPRKGKCEILPSWRFSNYTDQMSLDGEISPAGPTSLQKIPSLVLGLSMIRLLPNFLHHFSLVPTYPSLTQSRCFSPCFPSTDDTAPPPGFLHTISPSWKVLLRSSYYSIYLKFTLMLSILSILKALC